MMENLLANNVNPGNMIGSCNSRSHGPIEFEDFFNLIRDCVTRKASIKTWYCSCSTVAYELKKILKFDWTM